LTYKQQPWVLIIYPNPASNLINIDFKDLENTSVEVLDSNSRLLFTQKLSNTQNAINIDGLATGIYMFKVLSNQGITTTKIFKN
jgi:hypothetical protein